jgi:hypothetical protein
MISKANLSDSMFDIRQDLSPEDFIRKEIDHLFVLN